MKIEKDVIYGTGGDHDLKLDIYLPDSKDHNHTAVILLHGGAWRLGDKSMMEIFGPELAGHGFVALAPEYRLLGEAPWPAQIKDVKTAIRWTKANADSLAVDPNKVVVQGFSAGGHLALMAGGTPIHPEFTDKCDSAISDSVAAVVAFFPPVELTIDQPRPGCTQASLLLGESPSEAAARKASPINYVTEGFPPTFLLHGTADTMVSYLTSQRLFDALHEKGVMVELHLYPNHIHEFVRLPSMVATTQAEIALFLKRAVVDSEKYFKENQDLNMFAKMDPNFES
jgi:acetyl esterase/lipase